MNPNPKGIRIITMLMAICTIYLLSHIVLGWDRIEERNKEYRRTK